ncbi:GSCOCG00005304001-RA-CDS [Cotesia congregata]|nr:GSCOCG00005304001-RA-CDS [Cotesia congregata]
MAQGFVNRNALTKSLSNMSIGILGLLYFILFKSIGLLPWHFNYMKLFKWNPALYYYNYGFSTSLLGTYWSVLYSLGLAYVDYCYMVYYPKVLPKKIGVMIVREQKLLQCASLGIVGITMIIYGCRQSTLINPLNEVQEIDDRLMKITGRKVKNGCSAYCVMIANLVVCAGVSVAKYIELDGKPFFQFFMTVYPCLFSNFLVLQYVMSLDVVIKRFIQLHYAIVKVDNDDVANLKSLQKRKQRINNASRQRRILFVSNILEDLDDIRLDVLWFFSPQLGIAIINMTGIAAVVGYDINQMWKGNATLQPMELFMYGLWYATVILVLLVLIIYYSLAKIAEKWTRYKLWLITDFSLLALADGAKMEEGLRNQAQERLEGDGDLQSLDVTFL